MEVEEILTQACKFPRVGNGTSRNMDSAKIVLKTGDHQYPDDEEDGAQHKHSMSIAAAAAVGIGLAGSGTNRLRGWPNSRIIRVSRSSGGKDRHSKVLTSKGLRDRRVRLSVATAIQFYDIQDRLGYDQPSKAVEWLIKAASDSIAELPSLNGSFPDTPQQFSNEKRASDGGTEQEHGFDSAEVELDGDSNFQQQQQQNQNLSLSKSACSSNSENSKGSGLSLSRSELRVNRVRARERARERTAKEKETNNQNLNPISQNSSFTELLTGAISTGNTTTTTTNTTTVATTTSSPSGSSEANPFHKTTARQWSSMAMEYFNSGLLGGQFSRGHPHHTSGGFPGQIQMGNSTNSLPQAMQVPAFTISTESGGGGSHHLELPHISFVHDHLIPVAAATGTSQPEYNLNFSISSTSSSSGLGGFNRGTLQSNSSSPSLLPHHLQRFTSPVDGPSMPFLLGTAMPVAVETNHHHQNHHIAQFQSGIDGRLQLCYSDRTQHAGAAAAAASNHKGKTKNE